MDIIFTHFTSSIAALEADISIIQSEQDVQTRSLLKRKDTLDAIVADIAQLRLLGKGGVPRAPRAATASTSRQVTGTAARTDTEVIRNTSEPAPDMGQAVSGEATDAEVDIIVDADGDGDVEMTE